MTPWTVARQAPLSMGFLGQNTGMGHRALFQGIFPGTQVSCTAGRFFTLWTTREVPVLVYPKPNIYIFLWKKCYFLLFNSTDIMWSESCSVLSHCDSMNCTVHGILQARILEWVAFPLSRGSSQSRDGTQDFHIAGRFFTSWATREAHRHNNSKLLITVILLKLIFICCLM